MMSVLSTSANPVITKASWDKYDKAFKPKPLSRTMVSKIVLIITQMVGPALRYSVHFLDVVGWWGSTY